MEAEPQRIPDEPRTDGVVDEVQNGCERWEKLQHIRRLHRHGLQIGGLPKGRRIDEKRRAGDAGKVRDVFGRERPRDGFENDLRCAEIGEEVPETRRNGSRLRIRQNERPAVCDFNPEGRK